MSQKSSRRSNLGTGLLTQTSRVKTKTYSTTIPLNGFHHTIHQSLGVLRNKALFLGVEQLKPVSDRVTPCEADVAWNKLIAD